MKMKIAITPRLRIPPLVMILLGSDGDCCRRRLGPLQLWHRRDQ